MTWLKPTLYLSRLVITKSNGAVYDEKFHHGLNVIRGKNSSGKTTIAKAIMYSLGADIKNWTSELLLCDHVTVEVIINNQFVTLRRPISDEKSNSMEIFWGQYNDAINASIASWERYPYRSTKSKSGFSRVLFQALDLPEVKGYQESNLTMHQILRLMYGDQSSPANKILGTEDFDSTITREAIGDLLCGVYSDELFNARVELTRKDKALNILITQLKSLYKILGKEQTDIKSLDIDEQIRQTEERLNELSLAIKNNNESALFDDEDPDNLELKKSLKTNKERLFHAEEKIASLTFDISDSEAFIKELKSKMRCINDSISIANVINDISYQQCPACFSDLTALGRTEEECALCGSKLHENSHEVNLHRIRNELELQVNESTTLLAEKKKEYTELNSERNSLSKLVGTLERKYEDSTTEVTTKHQAAMRKLYRESGYLERTLEDLVKSQSIIDQIKAIAAERDWLNSQASELREFISTKQSEQEKRKHEIASQLSAATVNILRQDLDRQDQFSSAEYIDFDFGSNSISVNGETTFSESSTVFLKNAFLLAMLAVSANDHRMRFPRFLLLDGIENGGMEQERSHNLQRLILQISDQLEADHQIIITTAEIAPDVEGSAAPVGEPYTSDNKSLKFASRN